MGREVRVWCEERIRGRGFREEVEREVRWTGVGEGGKREWCGRGR